MSTMRVGDPFLDPRDRALAAVRTWIALYTRGLPSELATARQELIEADLWDEARAAEWLGETASLGRQRWGRLLRGMPADLAWRLEQRKRAIDTPRRRTMRISKVQLLAIGAVIILNGVFVAGLLASPDFRTWEGMVYTLIGLALSIVGLLLAIPSPRAGFVIGLVGTGLAIVLMPWLFLAFLPVPIVLGYRLVREGAITRATATGA